MALGDWGNGEAPLPMHLDPLQYLGRVKRDPVSGRVTSMEVFYNDDVIKLEDGDEFMTFTTIVLMGGD